jgi:predicted RNA-binding Zn ribbon-like protein
MPGDRPPAPGRLRVVQALLNTINLDTGQDAIDTPAGLGAWMVEFGLAQEPAGASPAEVAAAGGLREALRLLVRQNGEPATDVGDAPRVLERAARGGRLTVRLDPPGPRLVPTATGVPGALAAVAAAAFEAMLDGSWHRLRACRRCHWAHYDRSRNLSARWCSMRYCGNRTKTRAYRSRRGGEPC